MKKGGELENRLAAHLTFSTTVCHDTQVMLATHCKLVASLAAHIQRRGSDCTARAWLHRVELL